MHPLPSLLAILVNPSPKSTDHSCWPLFPSLPANHVGARKGPILPFKVYRLVTPLQVYRLFIFGPPTFQVYRSFNVSPPPSLLVIHVLILLPNLLAIQTHLSSLLVIQNPPPSLLAIYIHPFFPSFPPSQVYRPAIFPPFPSLLAIHGLPSKSTGYFLL
jgi:hypothetical protein